MSWFAVIWANRPSGVLATSHPWEFGPLSRWFLSARPWLYLSSYPPGYREGVGRRFRERRPTRFCFPLPADVSWRHRAGRLAHTFTLPYLHSATRIWG